MVRSKRFFVAALSAVLCLLVVGAAWAEAPKNVILFIGDGMGFEQVKAASLYAAGKEGTLAFEPYGKGEVMTRSVAAGRPTDSAAAATALATGHKTANGRIGTTPDGRELPTVLECLARRGKWTGLVTTVPITHATPAGFAAHCNNRNEYEKIAADYFERSRPNVLFGAYWADGKGVTEAKARAAGYAVVRTREALADFVHQSAGAADTLHVSGQFAAEQLPYEHDGGIHKGGRANVSYETAPHLSEMTSVALQILSRSPDGFFLMVEGGALDWACHENHLERAVGETLEFAKAFQIALNWAKGCPDTLILVTADHECGGLKVRKAAPRGQLPKVVWTTGGHTGTNVPLYALGLGSERLEGVVDNTDLFGVMVGEDPPPAGTSVEQVPVSKEKQEALAP